MRARLYRLTCSCSLVGWNFLEEEERKEEAENAAFISSHKYQLVSQAVALGTTLHYITRPHDEVFSA
jgi:hypothetical protein